MANSNCIPSPDRLRELVAYDPIVGTFIAKTGSTKYPAGRPIGTKNRNGYIVLWIDKRLYYAHRVAWAISYGAWPDKFIDHSNNNPSDNRLCNLRLATCGQNVRNMRKPRTNTSGYKGVHVDKRDGRYSARIWVNDKPVNLGRFATAKEAAVAYNDAAIRLHGEFANLNEI